MKNDNKIIYRAANELIELSEKFANNNKIEYIEAMYFICMSGLSLIVASNGDTDFIRDKIDEFINQGIETRKQMAN